MVVNEDIHMSCNSANWLYLAHLLMKSDGNWFDTTAQELKYKLSLPVVSWPKCLQCSQCCTPSTVSIRYSNTIATGAVEAVMTKQCKDKGAVEDRYLSEEVSKGNLDEKYFLCISTASVFFQPRDLFEVFTGSTS